MTARFVRHPGMVWRVSADRVMLRSTAPSTATSSELVGAAALVWVAAESPADIDQIAADTGLTSDAVEQAVAILLADGSLIEADG